MTASALWFARSDRQNAQRARASAEDARKNTATARANEIQAERESKRAGTAEGQARQEAAAARLAERIAQSRQLAAESQLARASDARLALLLATEGWKIEPTMESRRALYEALHERWGFRSSAMPFVPMHGTPSTTAPTASSSPAATGGSSAFGTRRRAANYGRSRRHLSHRHCRRRHELLLAFTPRPEATSGLSRRRSHVRSEPVGRANLRAPLPNSDRQWMTMRALHRQELWSQ